MPTRSASPSRISNFVLAMVSPEIAPGLPLPGVNFYSVTATAAKAGLVGTDPYVTLEATDLSFHINAATIAGKPAPCVYLDYTTMAGGQLDVPTGSAGDKADPRLRQQHPRHRPARPPGPVRPVRLRHQFQFRLQLPDLPGFGFPSISLTIADLLDLLPSFSPNFDFLMDAFTSSATSTCRSGSTSTST